MLMLSAMAMAMAMASASAGRANALVESTTWGISRLLPGASAGFGYLHSPSPQSDDSQLIFVRSRRR